MKKKQNRPVVLGDPKKTIQSYDNSVSTQRKRLLKHFEACPRLSTLEARNDLGIMHPGGRVCELRRQGFRIVTHWQLEPDSNGICHRVGVYVFQGYAKESHDYGK